MVPLYVVMRYEFSNGVSQCILTKEDNLIQTARTPPYSESDGHDERRSICGSSDIYAKSGKGPESSINFVTCHDGFTLNDLVSYRYKHNEANGENNHDGTDYNFSENHGAEGATTDVGIEVLRKGQIKNFLLTLLISRGVPMLLGGGRISPHARRQQQCLLPGQRNELA